MVIKRDDSSAWVPALEQQLRFGFILIIP